MIIDVVGVMEKPFELEKFMIEENIIDEEYVLLVLGTGKDKRDPSYSSHRGVEVIGCQEAYLRDDQDEYHGTVRKENIQWCNIIGKGK